MSHHLGAGGRIEPTRRPGRGDPAVTDDDGPPLVGFHAVEHTVGTEDVRLLGGERARRGEEQDGGEQGSASTHTNHVRARVEGA